MDIEHRSLDPRLSTILHRPCIEYVPCACESVNITEPAQNSSTWQGTRRNSDGQAIPLIITELVCLTSYKRRETSTDRQSDEISTEAATGPMNSKTNNNLWQNNLLIDLSSQWI